MITRQDFKIDMFSMLPAINKAKAAYQQYLPQIKNNKYMVVIDYKSPSYKHRMVVIDVMSGEIVSTHHTAHGTKTAAPYDKAQAISFSNTPMSRKSCLGAMITGTPYIGKHGLSLNLHGLEKGINSNAYARRIVIHAADYMTPKFILQNGRAGCSWGCPAVAPDVCSGLVQLLKGGCFLFAVG